VRRREFITLVGGAAAAWPLAARAQQARMPVVGLLLAGSREPLRQQIAAINAGLKETGYVEGLNISVEYRFAEGQFERFPALAAELVGRPVAVLVTSSNAGAIAAKQATATIPIVFSVGDDPVVTGIVSSLNRPGGNMTGVFQFTTALEPKRLGLLNEFVRNAATIAVLVHPSYSAVETQLRDVREAARSLGVPLLVLRADAESEFDAAFTTAVRERAGALLVCASPFFYARRRQLVLLAARHALPAIYEFREFAESGGLMSYGTSLGDAYHQAGVYAGRILKGEKPADLPVAQVTRFEFVINLSCAKALGLTVPDSLLARADEVIE